MIKLKDILKEAKQVGIIYHYTMFKNGLKILQSNELKGADAADSTNANPVYAVSFTRDKRFHNNHNVGFDVSSFGQRPQVRFTIDGDKLSNKFKVQPYSQGGAFSKDKKGFEAEERVISNKSFSIPIIPYIKSIDILIEYKKPGKDDWDMEWDYEKFAPISAELVKFVQDKNLPINLVVNKNGDPWPDKAKKTILQKILNWFSINEANLKGTMTFRNWTDSLNEGISPFSKKNKEYILSDIKEYGDILEFKIDLEDTYQYSFNSSVGEFYDDVNNVKIIVKLKPTSQNIPEFKFYSLQNGKQLSFNKLKHYNPKVMNTIFKIFMDEVLPQNSKILIQPFDYLRYRLFRAMLNNNLDGNQYKIDTKDDPIGQSILLVQKLNESKKPYKHKHGFDNKLGKDPFGLNQFAREIMQEDSLLKEGRYDTITNKISGDVFRYWKNNLDKGVITFNNSYEHEGEDIDVEATLTLIPGIKKLNVDGGADDENDFIVIKFELDPTFLPKFWKEISFSLKDVVRHEIEHLTHGEGFLQKPGKYMENDEFLRQMIDSKLLSKAEYFKLEKEVDANLQGMYFRAKKERRPFKDVINTYLNTQNITPEEKEEILNLWRKRVKALSLPIFENEEKVMDYKIFLDMDGVLVDFDEQFKELTGQYPKDYESTHTTDEFWNEIDNAGVGFWRGMKWMPGGEALYNRTSQFDHVLLSSPSRSEVSKIGKSLWRRDKTPNTKLILSRSHLKKNYAAPNHILIDDRESNIKQWRDAGGIGILYKSAEQVNKELDKLSL